MSSLILPWRHITDFVGSAIGAIRVDGGRGRCFEGSAEDVWSCED